LVYPGFIHTIGELFNDFVVVSEIAQAFHDIVGSGVFNDSGRRIESPFVPVAILISQ